MIDSHGHETGQEIQSPRKTKRSPVHIPDKARETKANFWAKPERALAREIAKYISETALAHMHPSVTYGPIAKNSEIHFLQKFSLNGKFKHDFRPLVRVCGLST